MKRLFIGIKIQPSTKLKDLSSKLKAELKDSKIKWVPIENMHITMKFLGETEEILIPKIKKSLLLIENKYKSFKTTIEGLGTFKKHKRTNIIWFGLSNTDSLIDIVNKTDLLMHELGFELERRSFNPHLTLGRVRGEVNELAISKLIDNYKNILFQDVVVEEIVLFESIFIPGGVKYKTTFTFKLS